jgi:hypothetical protein
MLKLSSSKIDAVSNISKILNLNFKEFDRDGDKKYYDNYKTILDRYPMLKRIELTGYDPIVNDYISLIDQTKP